MRATTFSGRRFAVLLLALVGCASMIFFWSSVTSTVHASRASSINNPKVLTDFYPSWYATRELLLRHRDPYGPDVNRELQLAYYGKVLDPSRPEERQDEQRFVYPLYFMAFVAPTVNIEFRAVRVLVRWFLVLCAIANLALWLCFIRPDLSVFGLVVLFALVLSSIPVLQNITILQPFLLPACFIAAAAAAAASDRLFLTGALLALSTVKPQICLLPLAWFFLWLCGDWKRRRSLFPGFAAMLAVLLFGSEWLRPDWLVRYPGVLRDYAKYTNATSFLGTLLSVPWNWIATLLALAVVAIYCWRVRRQSANSPWFAIALSLSLALTVLIVPAVVQPFNHVLLLPAVLLTIRYWRALRRVRPLTRAAIYVFCVCAFLPWLLAVVAVAKPFDQNRGWLLKVWSLPLAVSMALPFAAFGMLILLRRVVLLQCASAKPGSGPFEDTGLIAPKPFPS
jgi:hypothetical protein